MSNIKKWGKLYDLYNSSQRSYLVSSLYKGKTLKESWELWAAFSLYIVIAMLVFLCLLFPPDSIQNRICISLATGLDILFLYRVQERLISLKYKEKYSLHNLESHPFFSRTKLLGYYIFVEKMHESDEIKREDIPGLLNWNAIKNEKFDTFSFLKSNYVVMLITSFLSILAGITISTKSTTWIFFEVLFIYMFISFGWLISDLFRSQQKKDHEICRFLKWIHLETENPGGQTIEL